MATRKPFVVDEGKCDNGLPYQVQDSGLKYTKLYYVNIAGRTTPFRSKKEVDQFLKDQGVGSAANRLKAEMKPEDRTAEDIKELKDAFVEALGDKDAT